MTPKTTEAATRQGDGLLTTSRGYGSQHIPHPLKEQNMSSVPQNFTEGQKVRILAGGHAGKIGTVTEVGDDVTWVRPDGSHVPRPYLPEELAPVRTDDTVPATGVEVVRYVTNADRHGWTEKDPHACKHDEPHEGLHECERCADAWPDGGEQWRCPLPGCSYTTWVSTEALAEDPDALESSMGAHQADHKANGPTSPDVATYRTVDADVILYRLHGGRIHADLLTDARVDSVEHLRELADVLTAAAKTWQAAQ